MPRRKAADTVTEVASAESTARPAKKPRTRTKASGATASADGVTGSSKPAKRTRKKKDTEAPKPEKRGAMFKKSIPKDIQERAARVETQRQIPSMIFNILLSITVWS